MNKTRLTKLMSMLLAVILIVTMVPVTSLAATSGNEDNVIFFATDRHEESSKLNSLLKALAYTPGLVVLGGDHVNNTNSGSLASITSEIQSVYPGVQTFYTYAAHDPNVSEDSSNPYAYARTGEVYEGADYYVYGVDQDDMQSSSSAADATEDFLEWAEDLDDGKMIFVMCHMPIHKRRNDNAGGATWMSALNEAGEDHDIVFLWGHNHTGESSSDTSVYFVAPGGTITPQGGSAGTINFTYMNAGYIKNGYASLIVIEDSKATVYRHNTSGSVTATYTITREHFAAVHTHSYEAVTVDATCDAAGSITYTCSCGDTYTETIDALGHDYEVTERVSATCKEDGYETYTCSVCGDVYTKLLYSLGHIMQQDAVLDPTCEEDGYTSYVCITCGDKSSVIIPALGHAYESVTVEATCEKTGSVTHTCTTCGDTYTETIPTTGHNYVTEVVDPTCEKDGYTIYTCTVCGNSYDADEIVALGHDYETVTVEVTCEEDGCKIHTCANCGDSYVTDVVTALGHAYNAVTVAATCESDGSVTYTCANCGDSYTETIPALGHSYETVTVPATCESDGSKTSTCATCGDNSVEILPALGHSYESVTVAATCEEDGSVTYTCACGDAYTEILPALGHNYTDTVVVPNCVLTGGTTHTCLNCGDRYITDEVPALGHNYKTTVVAATCDTAGYTSHVCLTCGDSYVTDQVEAYGHTYSTVVTAPDCDTAGYTTYTCVTCGDSYVGDHVAAFGHQYKTVVYEATCIMSGYTKYTCTSCGESHVGNFSNPKGHTYICEEDGEYLVYTCEDCGDTYSEKKEAIYTYDKATAFANGNQYVITFYASRKYYALTHIDGELGVEQVTVTNGQVTSEITEDMLWTYQNKTLSYVENGTIYYLNAASSGWLNWLKTPSLEISATTSSSCSISSNKLKIGSYYLRYSSGNVSLNRTSASTTYIYIKNEA